jgi:hypothetical protein
MRDPTLSSQSFQGELTLSLGHDCGGMCHERPFVVVLVRCDGSRCDSV